MPKDSSAIGPNDKAADDTPNTDRVRASHARILVVDDQASNVQVVGLILGTIGHEIIPASDGATDLNRVAALAPDLICSTSSCPA